DSGRARTPLLSVRFGGRHLLRVVALGGVRGPFPILEMIDHDVVSHRHSRARTIRPSASPPSPAHSKHTKTRRTLPPAPPDTWAPMIPRTFFQSRNRRHPHPVRSHTQGPTCFDRTQGKSALCSKLSKQRCHATRDDFGCGGGGTAALPTRCQLASWSAPRQVD